MAKIDQYVNLDLHKQQLLNALHQRVTTVERSDLAATLNANDGGLVVYDTDLSKFFGWNGTGFVDLSQTVENAMILKGEIDASTNPVYPASPAIGDTWVITTAGSIGPVGNKVTVEIGDQIVYSTSGWFIVQANMGAASETVAGYIALATQAEVNAGTDDTKAVTALKLETKLNQNRPKKYSETIASLDANTPVTVTHNLALGNKNDFTHKCVLSADDSEVILSVKGSTGNALTVESNVALTNVRVTVIGL